LHTHHCLVKQYCCCSQNLCHNISLVVIVHCRLLQTSDSLLFHMSWEMQSTQKPFTNSQCNMLALKLLYWTMDKLQEWDSHWLDLLHNFYCTDVM
jgi:hypothetical protein